MKNGFHAIIALLVLLLTPSCGRNKGMFVLHGTVQDGTDSILVVGLDNRYEDVDTIFCPNGHFKWSFRPDTVTTLILVLPDGRRHPVFAEKDVESFITIPSDTGLFSVSGGSCNESYQSFYTESIADTSMQQISARIDSFITANPFSEVTPYLIYDRMVLRHHAQEKDIQALIKRMSGNMQDAPFLTELKLEFEKELGNNVYLDNYTVRDSNNYKVQFINTGGTLNHLLVCVWASWTGQQGLDARDTLAYFLDKYKERYFNVADLSIDVNMDRWKDAIRNDTADWFSYNDPAGWESKIVKSPEIQTIPAFVLFNGSKKILYKTSSIEALDKELDHVLPKKKQETDSNSKNKNNSQSRLPQPKKLKLNL